MPRESADLSRGPVSRAICVFQEKWVLHIVHTLLDGPRGFNELGRDVGGCNPSTLNQRLARLEEMGLVRRQAECEGGRSAYALTEAGEALRDVIAAIRGWSASHLTENGVAHGVVVDVPAAGPVPSACAAVADPALDPAHDVTHDRAHDAPSESGRGPHPPAPAVAASTVRIAAGPKRLRPADDRVDVRPPRIETN